MGRKKAIDEGKGRKKGQVRNWKGGEMEHEEMKEEGVWLEKKVQQLTANGWDRWWFTSETTHAYCG